MISVVCEKRSTSLENKIENNYFQKLCTSYKTNFCKIESCFVCKTILTQDAHFASCDRMIIQWKRLIQLIPNLASVVESN